MRARVGARMKNKENKNQNGKRKTATSNEDQHKNTMAAELWWNSRSASQKMLAFMALTLIKKVGPLVPLLVLWPQVAGSCRSEHDFQRKDLASF